MFLFYITIVECMFSKELFEHILMKTINQCRCNEGVSFTYNTMVTASKQGGVSRINRNQQKAPRDLQELQTRFQIQPLSAIEKLITSSFGLNEEFCDGRMGEKNRLKSKSRFSQSTIFQREATLTQCKPRQLYYFQKLL